MTGGLELLFQRNFDGGVQKIIKHKSFSCKCDMKFSIFIPEQVSYDEKFHVLLFLAGAECNEQNFINRTDFHDHAKKSRFILVCPDTSPRLDLPGDAEERWAGKAASWYMDCTQEPFATNYQMYTYVTKELYDLVLKNFPALPKFGICGHSMGGSGAIVIGLRNPDKFPSISVFAANCNPVSWGEKSVFQRLLGDDKETWDQYNPSQVVKRYDGPRREILADQGLDDYFYHTTKTLNPEKLVEAAEQNPKGNKVISVNMRYHEGLDHGFGFVKRFWKDHFNHHSRILFLESQGL